MGFEWSLARRAQQPLAQHVSAGCAIPQSAGVRRTTLLKHLRPVERNPATDRQRNEFIFKAALGMVLRLIENVPSHRGKIRNAHGERPISFLPSVPSSRRAQPPRRVRLDLLRDLCDGDMRRDPQQRMHVVRSAANRERLGPDVAHYAGGVSPTNLVDQESCRRDLWLKTPDDRDWRCRCDRMCRPPDSPSFNPCLPSTHVLG